MYLINLSNTGLNSESSSSDPGISYAIVRLESFNQYCDHKVSYHSLLTYHRCYCHLTILQSQWTGQLRSRRTCFAYIEFNIDGFYQLKWLMEEFSAWAFVLYASRFIYSSPTPCLLPSPTSSLDHFDQV